LILPTTVGYHFSKLETFITEFQNWFLCHCL